MSSNQVSSQLFTEQMMNLGATMAKVADNTSGLKGAVPYFS